MAVSRRGSSASGLDVSSAGLTDSPRPSNIPTEEAIVYVGCGAGVGEGGGGVVKAAAGALTTNDLLRDQFGLSSQNRRNLFKF